MSWLKKQVSLYKTHSDNYGKPATLRNILFSDFSRNLATIIELNKTDPLDKTKILELKATLQCFTPAALLECKAKDRVKEISRTGLMQLDFDYKEIQQFDIEE